MENFIKEGKSGFDKSGFDFSSENSRSKIINANRLQVHVLAYNLFNWFRRLVLSSNIRKQQIDTICLKLLKVVILQDIPYLNYVAVTSIRKSFTKQYQIS